MPRVTTRQQLDNAIASLKLGQSYVVKLPTEEECHILLFYAYGRLVHEFGPGEVSITRVGFVDSVKVDDLGFFCCRHVCIETGEVATTRCEHRSRQPHGQHEWYGHADPASWVCRACGKRAKKQE